MSTTEKLLINDEHKSGYLKDVWNSLFDPDIIRSIEEDNLTIKAIIMLLETAVISVKAVAKELKETENEKKSLQKCLQTIKTDNEILKQPCRQCPELQKRLTEQIKKTKDCKRSIQSIFTLLKPMTDSNGEDTQKAFLETQTIMGKYIAEDNDIIPETPGCSTKAPIRISSKSDHRKYQSEFEIISSGEEQYNCSNERVTPEKDNGKKTSAVMSPVLKSAKRTIQFKESQKRTSPDKSQKRSESQTRSQPGNNTKLEWKLRADEASSSRLKQATLSVKARPRPETKRDLSMMEGFSGGTLAGGGGTLAGAAASSKADESDDCIATSPGVDANRLSGLSLSKKRPRTSKETVDTCGQMPTVMTLDETHFEPMAASTCKIDQEEKKLKKNHPGNLKKTEPPKPLPASTSRKELTAAANPVFRYERGAVKKKSERLKLDGWSCDDCEKYYANMEKAGMNASQIKRTMNKCSRHRNQFQRAVTPPDFWNPKFDTSDEESY